MWTSIIIYFFSWPPFILGVYWVGKEYAANIQKYFNYKFYHQSIKHQTKKAIDKGKQGSRQFIEKGKKGTKHLKKKIDETKKRANNRFKKTKN